MNDKGRFLGRVDSEFRSPKAPDGVLVMPCAKVLTVWGRRNVNTFGQRSADNSRLSDLRHFL